MKKLFVIFLLFCFTFAPNTFAARTSVETLIASTTLDADPVLISGDKKIKSAEKVAFWVTYDETEVGGGLSVAVTLLVSPDDVTYLAASFYDYAGGATLQTSETISSDGTYVFWMNPDFVMPYARVVLTATGSDADDTAIVTTKIITQE